jgi:hypothetical protein
MEICIFSLFLALLFFNGNSIAAPISICPSNFQGRYYIVYTSLLPKDGKIFEIPKVDKASNQIIPGGLPFAEASLACSLFGMRLGNITSDLVENIVNLWTECTPDLNAGLWFGWYEGLPIAYFCNILETDDSVVSDPIRCTNNFYPVLCEIPFDPITSVASTTSTTTTSISGTVVSETTVFTSTETLTSFFLTRFTSTVVNGTLTSTTVTSTTTSCSNITRVHTQHCCPSSHRHHPSCRPCNTMAKQASSVSPSSSNSLSSWNLKSQYNGGSIFLDRNCCQPDKYLKRQKYRGGCHDCSPTRWWDKEESWNIVDKRLKRILSPKQTPPFYRACNVRLNNFTLVQLFNGTKSGLAPKIDGHVACSALGFNLANITVDAISNLVPLFTACNVFNATVFDSYYNYTPFCGVIKPRVPPIYMLMNDFNNDDCTNAIWALCRDGPAGVVTSRVPTGPFTTVTITQISTAVSTVVEVSTVGETVTASDPTTVVSSSFFPTTTTTSTTITFTATNVSTSTTSCCCNPVICTSIQVCCRQSGSR